MDIEFLKRLQQKLQIGNTRSIHLNAVLGRYATRLDLSDLNYIKPNLAQKFLEDLVSKDSFTFRVKINSTDVPIAQNIDIEEREKKISLISKRLTSISFENEDNFLEHGIKTFGFGFPIIAYKSKNDPSKIIYAPLIIWKLDLLRSKNKWVISKEEDFGILANEVLLNYLEQDLNSSGLSRIPEEDLQDNIIDRIEINNICNKLLIEINPNSGKYSFDNSIKPTLSKDKIKEKFPLLGNPFISNSGIFGLFRAQKEGVIKDIKDLINRSKEFSFDNLITEKYQTNSYSSVETDPTQYKALSNLKDKTRLIIHGPPGTGKSQSLTAIIANALANKAKCLVVCEKKTALEVIKKNLDKKGLGELCGMIEDVNKDRKSIVKSVRERDYSNNGTDFSFFENLLEESKKNIQNINEGHAFLDKKLLNQYNWTDLVGKFLSVLKKSKNYNRLYEILKNGNYNFLLAENSSLFNKDKGNLQENYELFVNAKDRKNYFSIIRDDAILSNTNVELKIEIKASLQSHLKKLQIQINLGNELLEKYRQGLISYYKSYNTEANEIISSIIQIYETNINRSKNLFISEKGISRFSLLLCSIFSKKHKLIRNDKEILLELFNKLTKYYQCAYFETDRFSNENPEQILKSSNSFKNNLLVWYSSVSQFIQNSVKNLEIESLNVNSGVNLDELNNYYFQFRNLIIELNQNKLLNFSLSPNITTVRNMLEYLDDLVEKLENYSENIEELHYYFEWRKNYLGLNNNLKIIVDALIQIDSFDWSNDFEAWFIFNILRVKDSNVTLRNDSNLNKTQSQIEKMNKLQVSQIRDYWRNMQQNNALQFQKKYSFGISALYNLAKNGNFGKRNPLRKIIQSEFELFTNHFPVLLMNPTVCSSLLPMKEGLFDIVIFDEASQLRIEDVYSAKLRGKYKIVAGDENQMPPSSFFASLPNQNSQLEIFSEEEENELESLGPDLADSESLLEFAKRKGYEESYLEIHYRSKHPDLIEFSNAAFYGARLKPLPAIVQYKAVRYLNVNGTYNQGEGVNLREAEKVIEIIDEEVDLEKDIPSIGIATLNILQRNLILNLINSKSDENPEFAQKIFLLKEKAGESFFVKNLENIQGDERDIIIISTTFGIREDGSFIQNYGPINQQKGYRLLNVIITRAKNKIYVCTSIPEIYISEYSNILSDDNRSGRGLFYAYLAYAKSIEDADYIKKENMLKLLISKSENKKTSSEDGFTESVFEQEVYDLLSQYIEPSRIILQYKLGGFRIDIAIISKLTGTPIVAIECDGAKYHSSAEAYAWDLFRQKFLENYGLKFIRIWSVNWWNSAKTEMEKLIQFINQNDA